MVIKSVPATGASYHSYVPPGAVAINIVELFVQILAPNAVGAGGVGLTVMV